MSTKILVVEDEGLTAMEIQRKLKNWGYDVPSFAFSKKEAVKKAEEIKPDLILMDIMLKGQGDGIDAANEIKDIRDTPIIYITAYDDEKTRKRAVNTHPNAYLLKPFEEKELHNKIESALSEHKLGKKLLNFGKRLDDKLKDCGIIVIDPNGYMAYINDFAYNLTGFRENGAEYKSLNDVFPLEGTKDKDVKDYLKSLKRDSTGITDKTILMGQDGKDVHVEYKITSIMDENEGFLGAIIVFEDISQQIKDEKSLMEREKKFRGIYYQSMLATEIFDVEGKLLDANPACVQLFGAEEVNQLKQFNLFRDFKLDFEEVENLKKGLEFKYEVQFDFKELLELGFNRVDSDPVCLSLYITPLKLDAILDGYLVQFQDITQHRRLEESLKDNEERYQKILDTLDQAVIAFNNDLKCIYYNRMINEFFNFKTDDIIGKSFQESMKSFWDEELEQMLMKTLESAQPSSTIKSYQKDDMPTYVEIKALKSSEGLLILFNDVNETKQMEETLKRNEKLYRSVVDDQSEIICRFNRDFELTFANEAYYHYFGLNNKFNSIFSLNKEDMDRMKARFKDFDEKNNIKIFEGPIRMSSGDINWWQWVTRANFDDEGNISEYQSVGHDVTQHHRAMEKIQNDIEELQSSIKEKNIELEYLKKSFESEIAEEKQKISSMEKLNEEMGEKFKEESQKLTKTINNQVSELEIFKDREKALKESLEFLEKDIQSKTLEAEASSKALEAEINIRKKTEENLQKKSLDLEKQLEKTKTALSKINNLKNEVGKKEAEIIELQSNFQTEISNLKDSQRSVHESLESREKTLKNVYNGVRMNMQMMSTLNRLHSEYVTDQMIEKLQEGRSYLRSFGVVHEKLYQSEDLETVDLGKYLNSILDDISRTHGAKNIDITIETNDISLDMENTVTFGLIISELVINSLKHAFPGDDVGKIKVEVENSDKDIVIKVSDNGIGIPPHISVETADSFGLQLVRTLIEQSEGSIKFEGDNGAYFIIKIPIKKDN